MAFVFNPLTGQFDITTPLNVIGAPDPLRYDATSGLLSILKAGPTQNGYLSSDDWNIFNSKLDSLGSNYITNPDAEIDTSGWNLYNNIGRTDPATYLNQDITFTAVAAGNAGNGIIIDYIFHASQSYLTPLVTVVSPTNITVAWYNGPTVANNPTATQLKAAWDAVPGAVAIATCAITGTASNKQYLVGSGSLSGGGDTSPTNGTGGVTTGITFTRNIVDPLAGSADFLFSKDAANREGLGLSTDITISRADSGNPLQVSFVYESSANMVFGTSSDLTVWIYDITNDVLIPVTPIATLVGPASTVKTFVGQFEPDPTSFNYRLIIHISTENALAWSIQLDQVTITSYLNAEAATQVPSVVLQNQPVSNSVTDHMAVAWADGATQWVPLTYLANGDHWSLLGFATNIGGGFADVYIRGYMDGFSFGPFAGYNQYVDPANPGLLTPLPSPFTDNYIIMGKGISATTIDIQPYVGFNLVTSKGGLLSNGGLNNGSGDEVLAAGANGNTLVANSGSALGLAWLPAVVAAAPFTYTLATRALTIATATNAVSGILSAADHTTYSGYAATIALKANIASPTFTGTVTAPTFSGALTGNASTATSATSFSGSLAGDVTGTQAATTIAAAVVTGKLLTGFVSGAGTVSATDSILSAFNKINGNVALKANIASPTFTGTVTAPTFSGALTGNVTGNASGSAASFTGSLVGDVTGTQGATAISAATVTGKLLTGFVSGAGTVAATDTILQGFNKLNGNVALKAPLATPTFTGDVNSSTGNILISTLGKGLQVKTGTNSKAGTAVLVGGTKVVTNTSVTANSLILLTSQVDGGTPGFLRVSGKVVGTSFTITSSNAADTSTVGWIIIELIP